ncbi:MAG: hypothetical protein SFW36_07560 [Leptolyngbyaceae cyanobacterium bins.59]|nr:hypothetical protein [Leptolyngbyaceae cyanobacterium bins.59]
MKKICVKAGSIVRLMQPFQPDPQASYQYQFGVVAGITASEEDGTQDLSQQPLGSVGSEVIIYLYDPELDKPYLDAWGMQALFYFAATEVEPVRLDSLSSSSRSIAVS